MKMKAVKIKMQSRSYNTLLPVLLLVTGFVLLPGRSFSQNQTDTLPNGTDGLVNVRRPVDTAAKKLPPNEFVGAVASFKIGMGYIHDGATYIKSDVFQKQLDSAKLTMDPMFKVRDFR